jgi:hypothetical protein
MKSLIIALSSCAWVFGGLAYAAHEIYPAVAPFIALLK